MITAKIIREKYKILLEEELKKLQDSCSHETSTWCEEWWAIGHSTGRNIKVCDICEKTLEIKNFTEIK